jgi:NAD(P)-dependent dehydrogenase (short-subunit alcohol dehydrogenase family)
MILITGAAQGLGAEIALELARRGYSLLLHYRKSADKVEEVALWCREWGVQVETIQGDFSSSERTDDFIGRLEEKKDRIQGLVNNVGQYFVGSFAQTSSVTWRTLFESNLHAPYALITCLLPSIKKAQGRIVNVGTSGLKSERGSILAPAYRTSKMGLAYLTLSLSKELARDGVTVNMVSPGYMENSVDLPDSKSLPMQRPASLLEVAKMVAFFFEKEADYITGQNIEVAGGI